ncbi:RNA-binding cell elongation regulator Jag/EloR [Haploplasma axanthum]|uniref:R3H domain n=1 Tax=Haploplasma axanthum TaxID=29552 RepID=A0A449BBY2_HAPAX|nr:RNA-binding cell elongation regulator Jag/EloR [Haploplasma axanthum]VEU79946.1 R3H domain [Haploplasma axanthum]
MLKKVEIEAKTLAEAEKKAIQALRIPLNKLKFNIIKEKRGILGIGASTTYDVTPEVNLALEGKSYIEDILKNLGIDAQMEMRTKNDSKEIYYNLYSEENALLIGREGRTLKSLQFLVRNYLNIFTDEYLLVNVDIGNYNDNRQKQLEIMATKTAKEVARTRIEVKLDPMNAYERRIIHSKLAEWRDVYTESIGEGEERSIIIKPTNK